jgi:putative ABC transport system permease protein
MLLESLHLALVALWSNRMRAFLTTLGIVIGVSAVIAIVAIVQGLSAYIKGEFAAIGATYVRIAPRMPAGETSFHRLELTAEDAEAVAREVPHIRYLTPLISHGAVVKYGDESRSLMIIGSNEQYPEIANHHVDYGRFFSAVDIEHRKNACVVGKNVLLHLKIGGDPIGREIRVGGEPFKIIGVFEEKGETFGFDRDEMVFIPIERAFAAFGRDLAKLVVIEIKVEDEAYMEPMKERATEVLRRRHGLKPGQPDDFQIVMQTEMVEGIGKILGFVTLIAAGIVGISLVVGGIGIMNIMLVSVTERTREIGVRKAVGAKRQDILMQFLIEALVLSAAGGVIGIALGFGIGKGVAALIPGFPAAAIPLWTVALAFGFSAAVGLFFGIYPAMRASALNPIEALRYE